MHTREKERIEESGEPARQGDRKRNEKGDEFIHRRTGGRYKCKIGNTYEICVGSSKKG